ncbi:hypothetical protein B7494_g5970 [Chlorociboria aeruginascens]|nr:hypothetical protein B7494_g5970 [Chlorociboria aeruginascens]
MTDFVELGIEGVDKVIDKHFHRLPNAALQSKTYHPRNIKKIRRKHRRSSPSTKSSSSEDIDQESRSPQYSHLGSEGDSTTQQFPLPGFPPQKYMGPGSPPRFPTPPQYSREPPVQRREYMPASSQRTQAPYSPNRYIPSSDQRPPYLRTTYAEGDSYYSDTPRPRRPRAITRRSSSYHGRPRHYSSSRSPSPYERDREFSASKRGSNKVSDTARRYGLKEELESSFTKSGAGLAAGSVGAVIGGWAAKQAQVARKGERGGKSNVVLTALGAAVGGLAVNAVVERWEESKREAGGKSDHEDDDRGGRDVGRRRDRRGGDSYSDDG